MKLQKNYYEGLLKKADLTNFDIVLFIGDDLDKDFKGALENNIDICWCNYENEINEKYGLTYEIKELIEMKKIL